MDAYIVISWDNDEEQCMWDLVMARSSESAKAKVAKARDSHAVVVDALNVDDLHGIIGNMQTKSAKQIKYEWDKLKRDL